MNLEINLYTESIFEEFLMVIRLDITKTIFDSNADAIILAFNSYQMFFSGEAYYAKGKYPKAYSLFKHRIEKNLSKRNEQISKLTQELTQITDLEKQLKQIKEEQLLIKQNIGLDYNIHLLENLEDSENSEKRLEQKIKQSLQSKFSKQATMNQLRKLPSFIKTYYLFNNKQIYILQIFIVKFLLEKQTNIAILQKCI